jgi:hypothetical protein
MILRNDWRQPREVRAADAKQDTRRGKHRDRQHHAFADLLEIGEGVGEGGHVMAKDSPINSFWSLSIIFAVCLCLGRLPVAKDYEVVGIVDDVGL